MSFKNGSEIAKMSITAKCVCYVRKQHTLNHIPPTLMPTSHPGQSIAIEFQSSGSVLKGTGSSSQGYWVSLDPMELSFITSFCHAQRKDLEKGKPHMPGLLQQSATSSQSCPRTTDL